MPPDGPSETIVVRKGYGLPYSKGLMAQALSATALSQGRSFELARLIERRLGERGQAEIDVSALDALAEEVLLEEEGELTAARYRGWRRLDRLDRPLVVLIGGTTGVGKSTLATMLAARLGVNRVIAHSSRWRPCRPCTIRRSRPAAWRAIATRRSGSARRSRPS
jgi:2-phosphoglycerate kinase